jgi:transposase
MLPADLRILVCREPVDMRRSFDGLALIARQVLAEDPQSGALLVFVNKRRNHLRALWWDRNGYCLLCKRLHRAVFVLPGDESNQDGPGVRVDAPALARLIAGASCSRAGRNDRNLH